MISGHLNKGSCQSGDYIGLGGLQICFGICIWVASQSWNALFRVRRPDCRVSLAIGPARISSPRSTVSQPVKKHTNPSIWKRIRPIEASAARQGRRGPPRTDSGVQPTLQPRQQQKEEEKGKREAGGEEGKEWARWASPTDLLYLFVLPREDAKKKKSG